MSQPAPELVALEQSVVELCTAPDVPIEALARLGDARIWTLYRQMVRSRLHGELKRALKRTHAALGAEAFLAAFEHQLSVAPPRARFFHGIVADFADVAAPYLRARTELPAHAADLLEYEAALWSVGDLDDRPPHRELDDFSFEGCPVLAPALRLLHLQHPVHRKLEPGAAYERRDVYLCVHRRPDARRARAWTIDAVMHDLLQAFLAGDPSVTAAVQHVASRRHVAVDQAFLEGLCATLADLIERGVILGCRRP